MKLDTHSKYIQEVIYTHNEASWTINKASSKLNGAKTLNLDALSCVLVYSTFPAMSTHFTFYLTLTLTCHVAILLTSHAVSCIIKVPFYATVTIDFWRCIHYPNPNPNMKSSTVTYCNATATQVIGDAGGEILPS